MTILVEAAESRSPTAPATSRLPVPVERWLRVVRPELDARPSAIYLEGPARFKRGRLPFLPMQIRVWNRLGHDRISELEVRVLGLTVMRGLDAFVDGRGFTRVGSELSTGPEIDQGAFHVMFLESLLIPSAWPASIRWEPIHADAARVLVPYEGGTEEAVVTFEPASGLPASYSTDRFKSAGAPKVWWTAEFHAWTSFGPIFYPGQVRLQWADDLEPWLEMRITAARVDPDMSGPLARARAVLAGAESED